MLKIVSSTADRYSKDRFIPLKNISVHVNIHSFAAEVCIKQLFVNSEETSDTIEAVYCFPIEEQAAIYSFQANLDDGRKIQGEIKEKTTAQRQYCHALKQGHGAFLLEQDEKSNDIFTISIGSLKPQSKCEIEILYVQELDLINDGQRIQFILPTAIAPRYSSIADGHGHIKSPGLTTAKYVQSTPYTISFSCSVSSLPIASISSPSHPIQVAFSSDPSTMEVSLSQENTHLDRDIIINIDLKQQDILTYTLLEKQALMISFVPTLELCEKKNSMKQINCEYIFIVDCSGSMSDENKIGYAQQAMLVFLKSLPIGTFFNIIRFGSTYEQFHKQQITIEYNEINAKKASDYITHMKADLGGTELYSALDYLHKNPPITNYSRQLFILTDGEIDNVDKVLRLCHSMSNTTRIFSYGLGSSPSRALVKGLARVTNGSYLFIPPKTHVDIAISQQLDKALEPCLTNIHVQCHFDNSQFENYRISPSTLSPIHAKQRLNIYIMLPKMIDNKLSGSIEVLTNNDSLLERITFNEVEPLSSLLATRLAAKSIITDLQIDDYQLNSTRQKRFNELEENDKKQQLINLSIQHQILSPFTAFIGIETRTEQEKATSSEMILREVPIQIRTNGNTFDDDEDLADYDEEDDRSSFKTMNMDIIQLYEAELCAAQCVSLPDDDEDDDEEILCNSSPGYSARQKYCSLKYTIRSPTYNRRSKSRSRSRSRSRSPQQRRTSNLTSDEPDDIIRQLINLQNFNGLWSIDNFEEIVSLLEKNSLTTNKIDFKNIFENYQDKNKDIILTMIIMFILMKYFISNEVLWKPIIKKSIKTMENQLGKDDYQNLNDKIKPMI